MITLSNIAQVIRKNEVGIPDQQLSNDTFSSILQLVFGLAGAIAIIVILLAGFRYITSQGNPQETAQAKNTIIYALIGLVICAAAFAIVTFVVETTG